MADKSQHREFTGRHMLLVMVAGFGIVMAVNFLMAGLATSGFGGVIVANSYVASQKYNLWLAEAERERALGWSAEIRRGDDGRLLVETQDAPPEAHVSAALRRPLGEPDPLTITLEPKGDATYASAAALPPGRWIVRLQIDHAGQSWRMERELP